MHTISFIPALNPPPGDGTSPPPPGAGGAGAPAAHRRARAGFQQPVPLMRSPIPRTSAALAQRREDWLTVLTLLAVVALCAALFVVVPASAV